MFTGESGPSAFHYCGVLTRPQYVYQMTLNGCRLGFYDPIRTTLNSLVLTRSPLNTSDPNVKSMQSLPINIASGASSGILGAFLGSPFFLVKTRLQSFSPFLPVGTQHQYRNAADGMRQIYGAEGVRGLWRGVGPAMVRTGFGSSVQLPTYFFAKRVLQRNFDIQDGTPLHLMSSSASGFVVCCVMHPPDTVMSRMYNQTGNLVLRRIRLPVPHREDGRHISRVQGLLCAFGPYTAAHHPYLDLGRADEQAHAKI